MREPLQKFADFAASLLPHETAYLMSVQQLADEDRIKILTLMHHNSHQPNQAQPFDTAIDKRKYHHLQTWINEKLRDIDVDVQLHDMLALEQRLATDALTPDDDKNLLKTIRTYRHPGFYFIRFYELVEQYRQFLLLRVRLDDYHLADEFLQAYYDKYQYAKNVFGRLHHATLEIVRHYTGTGASSGQWEPWLTSVFYDETLDGYNRIHALVRLTFIAHNYGRYDMLRDKYAHLEGLFTQGRSYSRRLLLDYYHNRLMLHAHFGEEDLALRYGYLAIRCKTQDYLTYLNNLAKVLLRFNRANEALGLLKAAAGEVKVTPSFHNRLNYVSIYLEALNKSNLFRQAVSYGDTFLSAYHTEILQHRWPVFFMAYFEALVQQRQGAKVLAEIKKYQLLPLESAHPGEVPTITIYHAVARYLTEQLGRKELLKLFAGWQQQSQENPLSSTTFKKLRQALQPVVPEVLNYLAG